MSVNVDEEKTKKKKDKKKKHKKHKHKSRYNMIDVDREELDYQLQINFQLKTFKKLVEEKMDQKFTTFEPIKYTQEVTPGSGKTYNVKYKVDDDEYIHAKVSVPKWFMVNTAECKGYTTNHRLKDDFRDIDKLCYGMENLSLNFNGN